VTWKQSPSDRWAHVANGSDKTPFPVSCCSGSARPRLPFPAAHAAGAWLLPASPSTPRRSAILATIDPQMSHLLQQIEFPPERHPYVHRQPPIVANDSVDLFKLVHAGSASSSRLPVRRLDGDLAAANSRSVPISVDGVAEVWSAIPASFDLCLTVCCWYVWEYQERFLFLFVAYWM
jgi:hypothetical protein